MPLALSLMMRAAPLPRRATGHFPFSATIRHDIGYAAAFLMMRLRDSADTDISIMGRLKMRLFRRRAADD